MLGQIRVPKVSLRQYLMEAVGQLPSIFPARLFIFNLKSSVLSFRGLLSFFISTCGFP